MSHNGGGLALVDPPIINRKKNDKNWLWARTVLGAGAGAEAGAQDGGGAQEVEEHTRVEEGANGANTPTPTSNRRPSDKGHALKKKSRRGAWLGQRFQIYVRATSSSYAGDLQGHDASNDVSKAVSKASSVLIPSATICPLQHQWRCQTKGLERRRTWPRIVLSTTRAGIPGNSV